MKMFRKIISLFVVSAMMLTTAPLMVAYAQEIVGVSNVARAPIGITAAHPYTLPGETPVWSIENAPEGVVMTEDGILLVPGETVLPSDCIVRVVAEDINGNLLAEKEVTLLKNLNADKNNHNWVDYPKRAYMNFEIFSEGERPYSRHIASSGWDDVPLEYKYIDRSEFTTTPCVIEEEADGNKYVSSRGTCKWSANGSTFYIKPKFDNDKYNGFYGRFMVENIETSYSLIFMDKVVDLRYDPISDNEMGIYLHSLNNTSVSPKRLVATVEPGKWFELWMNFYFEDNAADNAFEIYLDGEKIIDKTTCGNLSFKNDIFIGSAFDDAAYFTGFYAPLEFPELPYVYLTENTDTAVVSLDGSMLYGTKSIYGKAEYEIVGATASELIGNKLFFNNNDEVIEIKTKEIKIPLEDALEDVIGDEITIQTPRAYGIEEIRTIEKQPGIFRDEIDASTGNESVSVPDIKGGLMVSLDYSGDLSAIFSGTGNNLTIGGNTATEMKNVQIFLDTVGGKYYAFEEEKLFASGETTLQVVSEIIFEGSFIENFTLSSIRPVRPYVLNPVIEGNGAVGQTLSAEYSYYSPWGSEKTDETIDWLISDSATGEYEKIGEGESFLVPTTAECKYIKYSIYVSDDRQQSLVTESEAIYISPVMEVALENGTLSAVIKNIVNSDQLIVGAMLCAGGKVVKTVFNKTTFLVDEPSVTWETEAVDADGAVVSLFYPDDLLPVCLSQKVGQVGILTESGIETEESVVMDGNLYFTAPGTIASVIVYGNKPSDIDAAAAFSKIYTREEILAAAENEVIDKVKYIYSVETPVDGAVKIILPELGPGSYFAEIIPREGGMQTCLWMNGADGIFTEEVMDGASFLDILKLYSDETDEKVEESYNLYKGLENKNKVRLLMSSFHGDILMFDIAAYLVNYLENPSEEMAYTQLTDELKVKGFETIGADLLKIDAENTATASIIMDTEWNSFDSLMDVMYEKAVLYGIHHVRNYKETDAFLKTLTDTVYPGSTNKTKIQERVATKLYNNLEELREAVNAPISSGGTGGGGGGGGGGSSSSGSTSSGSSDKREEIPIKVYEEEEGVKISKSVFIDVPSEHWANESICYLFENKVISGTPEGLYQPEKNVTRAEFVKIICEAFKLTSKGSASFTDVNPDSWYGKYCSVAGSLGIILGSEGAFKPENKITREDAAMIIYRVLEYKGEAPEVGKKTFLDQASISEYAVEATKALASAGLISGMGDNNFCPRDNMTKAQCAQIVFNCLRR